MVDKLRHRLAGILGRPSMRLDSLGHELYFSLSEVVALLREVGRRLLLAGLTFVEPMHFCIWEDDIFIFLVFVQVPL